MIYEIKKWSGETLFAIECESLKVCLQVAVSKKTTLSGANLYGADLRGATLRGADLYGANLSGADLYGATLRGADLRGADLYGADLRGADLYGANLYGANLYGADLRGANLSGANLYGANLSGAKLYGATLRGATLSGANLGEKIGKLKERGIIQISPIGSRQDTLFGFHSDNGVFIQAGCFTGTIDEFRAKVVSTHGDNDYAYEYLGVANLIEFHFLKVRK